MPKKLPTDLLNQVTALLAQLPRGAAIDQLAKTLESMVSRRSLQRKLAEWAKSDAIRAEGTGRARRYHGHTRPQQQITGSGHLASPRATVQGTGEASIPLSVRGTEIRTLVRRPIVDRDPVGHRREFLDTYEPNVSFYVPEVLRRHLHQIGRSPGGPYPGGTYARSILERLLIDLSWNSSRLEGNTYSLLETQQLIQDGQVAPGRDPKETQMILNHKAAIELLVDSPHEIGINRYTIQNLHAILADNLLDDPAQVGRLREGQVAIAGSTYYPTAIPQLIDELFGSLLEKADAVQDPFEQSFFLTVHIPYLHPFTDVNECTARLAANIPLIKHDLVPLSYIDTPQQDYIDGLLGVYELNRVELARDVFAWVCERSCRRYKTVRDSLPDPDPFRLRYHNELTDVVSQVVRENVRPTIERVLPLAEKRVSKTDLQRFVALVVSELAGLHEGNIARFRLRPADFHKWARLKQQARDRSYTNRDS